MDVGYIIAMIGLGCMVGLSGAGSAIGLAITGQSLVGALKKNPGCFGAAFVPFGMPATQGLYGFVGFIMYNGVITSGFTVFQGAVVLGAGIAMGLACIVSAVQQGRICASGIAGIGSGHNLGGTTIILGAFPEFYAILSLVAAILMQGLLKA
jgi:V/A-type H+/Na+-transporting ATPase subunit K